MKLPSTRFRNKYGDDMYYSFIRYVGIGLNSREVGKLLDMEKGVVSTWVNKLEDEKIQLILN